MSPTNWDRFRLSRLGPDNRYVIHYAHRSREGFRSDPCAAGRPLDLVPLDGVHSAAYVDVVAAGLDTAFAFYRRHLPGLTDRLPRPLHVYLLNLNSGADGLTWGLPSGPEIWLRNRYEEAAGPLVASKIKATCAHELFHAHQAVCCPASLDGRRPWAWWGEATATCMEGQIDPSNTEFLAFLYARLDTPGVSTRNALRGYGDVLLCEFLLERVGLEGILEQQEEVLGAFDVLRQAVEFDPAFARGGLDAEFLFERLQIPYFAVVELLRQPGVFEVEGFGGHEIQETAAAARRASL